MHTCPQCGASSPADAHWCTQCYLPKGAAEPVLASATVVPSESAARFGIRAAAPAAAPAAPEAASPYAAAVPVAPPPSVPAAVTAPPAVSPPAPAAYPALSDPQTGLAAPDSDGGDGRLLGGRAARLVAVAIGLGGIAQLVAILLSHDHSVEPDTLIRYDIVLTVALYAIVATLIVSRISPAVRLRWGSGPLAARIVLGLSFGAGLSGLLLFLVSAGSGHLQPDPRIVLMVSDADVTHIAITVLISCIAAPLIEETLFRGLLLESLRARRTARGAIFLSGLAFAVWHLMPASLVYYTAMGMALGTLYVKRGLATSMAAHAGFNGVLTIAAIVVVLGPSHTVAADGLTMQTPGGWSVNNSAQAQLSGADLVLTGPSGALVELRMAPTTAPFDPAAVSGRLQSGALGFVSDLDIDSGSVREQSTAVGTVVEADITASGHGGSMAFFGATGRTYQMVFLDAGSTRARTDFDRIISSLHV